MIVTIDGPAGSGKSTAARGLATRIGFEYLDTGAMFRAVALALHRAGLEPSATAEVTPYLAELQIEMPAGRVLLNREDVSIAIRSPSMSALASVIGVQPHIRGFLAQQQRLIAEGRDMVCEGRDQGTAVFPNAECKFFLTAKVQARAERRFREMLAHGESTTLEEVCAALVERDRRDRSRAVAPLCAAPDAILLDTTELTPEEVLTRMEEEVRRCRRG